MSGDKDSNGYLLNRFYIVMYLAEEQNMISICVFSESINNDAE
jgi:hypothetical protein